MAHELKITSVPLLEVKNKDLVIKVTNDEGVLGYLHVSKGGIEWKNKNFRYHRKLRWKQFAELMLEEGRRKKSKY